MVNFLKPGIEILFVGKLYKTGEYKFRYFYNIKQ